MLFFIYAVIGMQVGLPVLFFIYHLSSSMRNFLGLQLRQIKEQFWQINFSLFFSLSLKTPLHWAFTALIGH